jgi:hypothetical protein
MDVRVVICWHPGNLYHASVLTVDLARAWNKMYPSRLACAIDLRQIGLLTIFDQDDLLRSDFDTKDKIIWTRVDADPEFLKKSGFTEIIPAKPN